MTVTHPRYDTRIVSAISVFAGRTAQARVELRPKKGQRAGLRLSGVGIVMSIRDGKLQVVRALAGSPAAVAGLRKGDLLLAIGGRKTAGMRFDTAIEAIRGLEGTPVRLRIGRGARAPFDVDVIRAEVALP